MSASPETSSDPPKQRRSRLSAERVLNSSLELLEEHGFDAFTVAEVSKRAGISVGAIYARFGNKEAMLRAVHAHGIERMSTALYFLFVLAIILPFQLGLVPTYAVMRDFGLVGSYLGIILLYTGIWMPFSVFLYTGFVLALPKEYEEASRVDGASALRTFRRVVFPLLRPVTGTVAIFTGLIIWNDFFLSLIYLNGTDKTPLPVAVYSFVGAFASRWNLIFAAVIVSLLPIMIFFLVAQRHLIRGFTGGIKT